MTAGGSDKELVTIGSPATGGRRDGPAMELPGIPGKRSLEAAGWQRRYLADAERAREAVELYSSLGYEVRAEQLEPEDFGPQCGECSLTVCRSYVLIYTRKHSQGPETASDRPLSGGARR